jgi:hypothetical protein
MKFTLTYDGELPPSGNKPKPQEKWKIRKQFDPQLRQLWKERPDLVYLTENQTVKKRGDYDSYQPHHLHVEEYRRLPQTPRGIDNPLRQDEVDLCEPIRKGDRTFFPLVRYSLGLTCAVQILFLRNEPRGKVVQSGDLDNRIKTLFDALTIPTQDAPYADAELTDPVYCLLEDDALITGIGVRTEQLLSRPDAGEKEVRLIIEVDVRVAHPRPYNRVFQGD